MLEKEREETVEMQSVEEVSGVVSKTTDMLGIYEEESISTNGDNSAIVMPTTLRPSDGSGTSSESNNTTITPEAGSRWYNTSFKPKPNASEEKPKDNTGNGTVADPIDLFTGGHMLKNHIMSLYGGQKLSLVAHYDSTKLETGSLGVGWYHNYEKYLEVDCCEALVYDNPSEYCKFTSNNGVTFTCSTISKAGYTLTIRDHEDYPYCLDCNKERRKWI